MKKIFYIFISIIGLIAYYFLNKMIGLSIPCMFHELTDLYCPGCGITRMFFSLLKLDFYQAFRYNPLVFCYLILYIIYKVFNIKLTNRFSYVLLTIAILFGILRNIPAFSFLKPTML